MVGSWSGQSIFAPAAGRVGEWPPANLTRFPTPSALFARTIVANIKSQMKRNRQNEKRRLRNKAAKSEIKTRVKTAVRAVDEGAETSDEDLRLAVKRLDKAAARGIIHKNQAANRKSALMRHVADIQASAAYEEGDEEDEEG